MKETVFSDLHKLYPTRINNKTNGITPRRWADAVQPGSHGADQGSDRPDFLDDATKLKGLDAFADDASFQQKFAAVKFANKQKLARLWRAAWASSSIRMRCSTSRSSASTNTSDSF